MDTLVKTEIPLEVELEERRKSALLDEMGITTADVDKLRKMMLSSDEAVAAKNEELTHIRQHKGQRDYWWEFCDRKRRMGRVMQHSEFIRRLRTVLRGLIVCRGGQQNRIGLYITKNVPATEIAGYRGNWKQVECPIYIGWMELGISPEYEIDRTNEAGVAVGQWRGWRTVLLNLIARKDQRNRPTPIITEEQALEAFGSPTNGDTSRFYRRRLWEFRNGRI